MNFISRRQAAAVTAIAFVSATVAIPALHLAFHALPHDHSGGEIHYHAVPAATDDSEHDHRDTQHDHQSQPFDPRHGEGSFAHFSLALSDAPAAPIVLLLSGAAPVARVSPPISAPPTAAHVSVRRFRGPPRG